MTVLAGDPATPNGLVLHQHHPRTWESLVHVLLSVSMPAVQLRWRQDQVRLLLPSREIYGPAATVRRAPLVDSLAYK